MVDSLPSSPSPDTRDIGILVVVSLLLALINWQPVVDHWVMNAIDLVKDRTVFTAFDPLYIPEAIAYAVRPLAFIILRVYFALFGLAVAPSFVATFVKIALFASSTYCFFSIISSRRTAFAVGLISASLPATIYSASLICEFDILGAAFIFFSAYYLSKGIFSLSGEKSLTTANATVGMSFAVLALLTKETTALAMGIFLGALLVANIRDKEFRGKLVPIATLYGALFAIVFRSFASTPPYMARFEPNFAHISFVVRHNIDQLVVFVPLVGISLMACAIALKLVPARTKFVAVVCGTVVLLTLLMPPIVTYRFYEAVYFSPVDLFFFFGMILLAVFTWMVFADSRSGRTLALFVLGTVALGIAFPLVSHRLRDDMSARVYLPLAPIIIYLAIESVLRLRRSFGRPAMVLSIPLIFFYGASTFNFASEFRARTRVEYDTKKAISGMDIGGGAIMFNNFHFWFTAHDALKLAGVRTDFAHLMVSPVYGRGRVPPDLASLGERQNRYFFYLSPQAALPRSTPDAVRKEMMGDFSWVEHDSYSFLAMNTSPFPGAGLGVIDIEKRTVYGERTWLDTYLDDHARSLYAQKVRFYRLPDYPDDIVQRLVRGIPLVIAYDYVGAVYKIGK